MSRESITARSSLVEEVLGVLDHTDAETRRRAARAAGHLRLSEAAGSLAESSLADRDSGVRAAAVTALNELGTAAASIRDNALAMLVHDEPEVRARAAWALGKLGRDGREPVGELCDRLGGDPAVDGRFGAAWALGRIRSPAPEAVEALARAVATDPAADVRAEAAVALGRVAAAAKAAGPALVAALADEDPLVREEAARALAHAAPSSDGVIAELRRALSDHALLVRRAAADSLRRLGSEARGSEDHVEPGLDEAAVRSLLDRLETDDDFGRAEACWLVGKAGPGAGRAATPRMLRLALTDRDSDTRWSALHAIGRVGAQSHETTAVILAALRHDEDPDVRSAAASALAAHWSCDPDAACRALEDALGDGDALVREEAADALGCIGAAARPAVDRLASLREDPHPGVRERAAACHRLISQDA